MSKYIIITTINPKSKAIHKFEKIDGWQVILIGDRKSQFIESNEKITYISVEDQLKLDFNLISKCPFNHYTRKNIGYLYALSNGSKIIYDTDDDNIPNDDWFFPDFHCDRSIKTDKTYHNIYSYFSDEFVWPRGYPLDELHTEAENQIVRESVNIGVWQGMADSDPDLDAIFRLLFKKEIKFNNNEPISLPQGCYSPFNSQNTLWPNQMIPYAYLPATTSFRFTDIIRGYIAQRMMWEHGLRLGFIGPTVYQERNAHHLMGDFKDEIECYLGVKKLVKLLNAMAFSTDYESNLMSVYQELVKIGLVKQGEIEILKAWLSDIRKVM